MRSIVAFALFVFALSAIGFGQDTTPTAQPMATPPAIKNDNGNNGGPPVLKGSAPATAATPQKASGEDEVIKVSTDLVTTPVSVLDRNGRFIPGLKKRDFQIFENGASQPITYFQSEEQPFTVILMLDISPSTKYKMDEIHFAAITFVNQLRPVDKVMVVAFDQRIHVLTPEPTADKQQIFAAIYKANFGSGTSIYEAVSYVTDLDLIRVPGRKAIVMFTDGVDTTSRRASFDSTIAGVQEIDALIYPIHYNTTGDTSSVVRNSSGAAVPLPADIAAILASRGLTLDPGRSVGLPRGTSVTEGLRGQTYLQKLAENTGGRIFEAADIKDLATSFAGIAEELRRQYSIGYYPEKEGQPGERRSLKIKVLRPNVVVRAKSGYVIRQARGEIESPAKTNVAGK